MATNGSEHHDLKMLLSAEGRDFLVRNNGDQVKVSSLDGKVVSLYFSASWCRPCHRFTPQLIEVYKDLSLSGSDFEVVFVSRDKDGNSFHDNFSGMPWLAIPFSDFDTRNNLKKLFKVYVIPHLIVFDGSGKILSKDVCAVSEFGSEVYPFSHERIEKLKADREAAKEQTLQSALVSPSRDFLITNEGNKIPVSELVGKNILLYFSAEWCPSCRTFLPKLIDAYHKIKTRDAAFEVIFISSDEDQSSFDRFFSSMPWPSLPYGDDRKKSLSKIFKPGFPSLVAISPTGKTTTEAARSLIIAYGADAYPFTKERVKEVEEGLPEKVRHALHEHDLVKTMRFCWICNECNENRSGWSFYCGNCDFDLHPNCVRDDAGHETEGDKGGGGQEKGSGKEVYVCDGDVCYKA